jgi:glycosyltransferase involved in cell wall biosynthesis
MRITYIAAGAAGAYCGACTRDVALVRALTAGGHDVQMLPLYTPIRTDMPDPSESRVFLGGINVYVSQRSRLFARAPRVVHWLLDRPRLLKLVSRFAIATDPADLGELTVSVLQGEEGRQREEIDRLVGYLLTGPRPDVVHLTNSMLAGLAGPLRERLRVPVVCGLQGEESFIDELPDPHRGRAWQLLRRHAEDIALFVSPGQAYGRSMAGLLGVAPEKVRVVRLGIETEFYRRPHVQRPREPFRIGYLGRLTGSKGVDLVCEAFRALERECAAAHRLILAGRAVGPDADLWDRLRKSLEADGLSDRFEYRSEPDMAGKLEMIHESSVLCLPVRASEPRGTVCVEAMAAGVPVVVPEAGIFPEILSLAPGGLCVPPDDAEAIAAALRRLRDDPAEADRLAQAGAAGVAEHFSARRMAQESLSLYEEVLQADRV